MKDGALGRAVRWLATDERWRAALLLTVLPASGVIGTKLGLKAGDELIEKDKIEQKIDEPGRSYPCAGGTLRVGNNGKYFFSPPVKESSVPQPR